MVLKMRWTRNLTALLILLCIAAASVHAQPRRADNLRIYEEDLRVRLDQQSPLLREDSVDFGGWFNFALFSYDDVSANRSRTLRQYQLRGWVSMNLHQVHSAYFRGLLQLDNWDDNDNPRWPWSHDTEIDEAVERAWYQFDLGAMMEHRQGERLPWGFKVKIGRQYMTIGTALALSTPLDVARFDFRFQELEFMAFVGNSIVKSTNPVDISPAVYDRQDRCFYGFELSYRIDQHRPFIYYFSQNDKTKPKNLSPWQGYDYSSRYLGLGSSGTLFIPGLIYHVEAVGEWGKTFGGLSKFNQDPICAWAATARLEYLFDMKTDPRIHLEYIFARGDDDRRFSSSATIGGNRRGTADHAFNGFGFRDTGIAYAPHISNIHIYSAGFRFFPLQDIEFFRRLELGTNFFFYQRNRSMGPISDPMVNTQAPWLGWEWDVYCNWRVTSDVSWTMRYGLFRPGGAYSGMPDRNRHFLYTGLSVSF
jgi:hypothetical protein